MAEGTIFDAARQGDVRFLRRWVDTDGDLDRRDGHDFTALHWAVKAGREPAVDLLIGAGADLNAKNIGGDTPLHIAATEGHIAIARKLIESGAEVTVSNMHGNTPLHYACFWRRQNIAQAIVGVVRQLLVTKGALVAAANKYGKTPLDRAGQALADELRIQATTLGQSLEVQAMPAVAYEELDAKARAKFVAEHTSTAFDISSHAVQYEEQLGTQAVATVVLRGLWSGFAIAAKKLVTGTASDEQLRDLRAELEPLKVLNHPNLQPLLGAILTPTDVAAVTTLQPLGSLDRLLFDPAVPIEAEQANGFIKQIARGLHFLHTQATPLIHGNLKPSNILIADDLTLKLAEYGVRTLLTSSMRCDYLYEPQWVAPEVLRERDVDIADLRPADMYSFGMVVYAVATRLQPFADMNPMVAGMKVVREGLRPTIPDVVPKQYVQITQLCWNADPAHRARMDQLLPILEKLTA